MTRAETDSLLRCYPRSFTAARVPEVLSAFTRHPDAALLAVLDEDGAAVGRIARSSLPDRAAWLHPLSVATARDLVRE